MRRVILSVGLVVGVSLLLTQFTNCDVYSESGLFQNYALTCEATNCNQPNNADFLQVKANYNDPFWVPVGVPKINIGGDCNEGGFDKSVVIWRLYDQNLLLTTSDAQFAKTGNSAYEAPCENGRFTLLVHLVDDSNVTRYGLEFPQGSGSYSAHSVEIEIFGIDENGERNKNPSSAPETVRLVPVSFGN